MPKLLSLFSVLLSLLCRAPVAKANGENNRVQAEFVTNITAIQPGKPFWAGFKFTIAPGYHIYWKNPGDSGLATEVKLNLPAGFTAGELLFPVPQRLQLPGDIINYAYENQVMLLAEITPPKELPVGQSIKLEAKTNWLVCKEDCTPGHANVVLNLPVAEGAVPANQELYKTWTHRLPVKSDSTDVASWTGSITREQGTIKITWKIKPGDIQYFPGPVKTGDVSNAKVNTTGNSTTVTFDIKNHTESQVIEGVVVFTTPAGLKMGLDVKIPGVLLPE